MLKTLRIGGLKGKSIFRRGITLLQLPIAILNSAFLLARFGPHVVLGGGGYASGPVCLAASLQGLPVALLEVNSMPGLTNRKLSKRSDLAFVAFKETAERMQGCRAVVTGNPVRSDLRVAGVRTDGNRGKFRLLVLGGSQGAVGLNSLVIEALEALEGLAPSMSITHQAGLFDLERVRAAYSKTGLEVRVEPFIENMAEAYGIADMVICRAGATTVAELIATRKPAILIPLPVAADNHQEFNARVIVDAGGGELLRQNEATGAILAERIAYWYHRRERLPQLGAALESLDRPDAANRIAEELIVLAGRSS